ncbi:MAG: GNVR domain-containing protein [candidate division KSB1 bacterium]|nr:GNVR domain-containing protein [candidate division KSB1 bacterium]
MNAEELDIKEEEQNFLYSFIDFLQRRWWCVALCLIVLLAPVLYYNHTATRVYEASATLIYEQPNLPVNMSQQRYRYPQNETILNQIQEIKSRSVAMETAQSLPQWAREQFSLPENRPDHFDKSAYYAAIIRSNLSVAPLAESDIIQVKLTANHDPQLALALANTLCDVLKERNLRLRRQEVSSVRSFIEEQQLNYKQRLEDAEEALRRFKTNNQVTSLDREIEEQLKLSSNIELRYQEARSERERAEQHLKTINSKIQEQKSQLAPSIADMSTQQVQQLKQQLSVLKGKYINLQLQGVSETNSKMIELQNSINTVQKELAEEARRVAESEFGFDPVSNMSSLYEQKVKLELELDMYRTQERSLQQALERYETGLQKLPQKEYQLARLQRERDLAESIYMMLSERREEARINEAEKIGSLRIIDRPHLPGSPIKPRSALNLAIAVMLGLTVGVGLAFFMEAMDTGLKTVEELENKLGLPVLGAIPLSREGRYATSPETQPGEPGDLVTFLLPSSPVAESYRTLRTNLNFSNASNPLRSLMLTSAGPQEGKSTTSANLAVATAQMGLKTLLIDADLRRPTQHRIFNVNRDPGLADVLLHHGGHDKIRQVHPHEESSYDHASGSTSVHAQVAVEKMVDLELALYGVIHRTKVDNLSLLTSGTIPPNPSEALGMELMKDILSLAAQQFDSIIVDAPPIIAVTDAAVLAPLMDATVIVVESGRNDKLILTKAKNTLKRVKGNLLGSILNRVQIRHLYGNYDYYYTYYSAGKKRKV